ncbi:helix-turn-helix domain-containing protein [Parapedobacter deserti]|uniref:Helix-turn-helix domain-containing protein n=1 Tax=Parapedobacter deserti TaxID=1912957 RepID=A0ABV7JPM2_9SPHI
MKYSAEIVPGRMVYSLNTEKERIRDGLIPESLLVLQISGQLLFETSSEKILTQAGDMLLVRKNQLAKATKIPADDGAYQTILILLNSDTLRKYALEHQVETTQKYKGAPNILLPQNEFLEGFFKSLMPYANNPKATAARRLGSLKVREAVELLLDTLPELKYFLFDFSEPYKIDLESFMFQHFQFNVPLDKFARLTGRSLASFKRDFHKAFGMPPRQWLQEKRLEEARRQLEQQGKKPSEIYMNLGFESLHHFSNAFKRRFGTPPTKFLLAIAVTAMCPLLLYSL